jgi:hypothetical protein
MPSFEGHQRQVRAATITSNPRRMKFHQRVNAQEGRYRGSAHVRPDSGLAQFS